MDALDGEADLEAHVGVHHAEEEREQRSQHDGPQREFSGRARGRDVGGQRAGPGAGRGEGGERGSVQRGAPGREEARRSKRRAVK